MIKYCTLDKAEKHNARKETFEINNLSAQVETNNMDE